LGRWEMSANTNQKLLPVDGDGATYVIPLWPNRRGRRAA
jgi:hypothetical protein